MYLRSINHPIKEVTALVINPEYMGLENVDLKTGMTASKVNISRIQYISLHTILTSIFCFSFINCFSSINFLIIHAALYTVKHFFYAEGKLDGRYKGNIIC